MIKKRLMVGIFRPYTTFPVWIMARNVYMAQMIVNEGAFRPGKPVKALSIIQIERSRDMIAFYMQKCHEMGLWGGQTDEDGGRQLYDFYWLETAAAARDPKCGGGGEVAGSQPMNSAVHMEPKNTLVI